MIAFLELTSGIRLPGGGGKPCEGPDAPGRRSRAIGPGKKSRRGGSGPGIGARSGGRVQVIAGALQGEVVLAVGGQDREAMGGELSWETPAPA